jgi:thiosulfate/3-mercaptopyruvate sulfurtransferase
MLRAESIVSIDWLFQRLEDPGVAIVDCRFSLMQPQLGRQEYEKAHIPGAYYLDLNLDLSSPVQRHGGRHPLPDPFVLGQVLAAMGIHTHTRVVAYDASRLAFAARLWWLLRYLGHDRVAVLDGGFPAWQAAEYPVTSAIPPARAGQWFPQPQPHQVVDIHRVKLRHNQPGVVLIDSREPERYRGEREPIDPVAGHIPGAINFPWQDVTDHAGHVKPMQEQQARWSTISPGAEVIVYCGSGVTACVNLLSLHLAGVEGGKLYAGSWSDWCSYLSPGEDA